MKKLKARVKVLMEKNEELTQQIIKDHVVESERMIILLRHISYASGPSSKILPNVVPTLFPSYPSLLSPVKICYLKDLLSLYCTCHNDYYVFVVTIFEWYLLLTYLINE